MEKNFVPEAQCPVCSKWLLQYRRSKRLELAEIPLAPVCVRCTVAFFKNIGMINDDPEIEAWLEGKKH